MPKLGFEKMIGHIRILKDIFALKRGIEAPKIDLSIFFVFALEKNSQNTRSQNLSRHPSFLDKPAYKEMYKI